VYIYCSKRFHDGVSPVNILYSNQRTPLILSLALSSYPHYLAAFSVFCMPASYTEAMYFVIVHCHPLPLSPSPSKQSHYCKDVLALSLSVCLSLYIYTHTHIHTHMNDHDDLFYLCIHLSLRSIFHICV
jgi:hypothetical protein